jgi:hypothetical protein
LQNFLKLSQHARILQLADGAEPENHGVRFHDGQWSHGLRSFCGFWHMPSASTAVFLFIDTPNMVVHGGGHALFGWFGATLGLSGGTILQWLVPLLLAVYFFPSAASCWVRFLPVLLFRELNLHRNLHGRRTDDGIASGHAW